MASQGASLQNYNNELVKCALRPESYPRSSACPSACLVWLARRAGLLSLSPLGADLGQLWAASDLRSPCLASRQRTLRAQVPAICLANGCGTQILQNSQVHLAGIEDLKEKREEVNRQILQDEEEKQKIQNDLRILTERCLLPRAVSQMCWECRLTVYACPKCGLRQALAHQRLPGAQSSLAQRVRQDDHGDGGGLHENPGKLADAVARPQARKHISDQEKAGLFLRPSTGDSGRIVFWAPTTNPMPDLSPLLALIYLNYQRTQGPVSSPRALSFTSKAS